MKKSLLLFSAIFFLALRSFATVHIISVGNYTFSPTTISANVGDTVKWVWQYGSHNTTSTTIPGGAATWSSALNSSTTSFSYVPTVGGTYNYECTFHASMGMTGIINVAGGAGVSQVNKTPIINVYPNPVAQSLHIQFNSEGSSVTITLTDMNGKHAINRKFKRLTDTDLDVRDIPNGS